MKFNLPLSGLLLLFTLTIQAQQSMPRVFLLGENEKDYQALTEKYPQQLQAVCDNNLAVAFEKWVNYQKNMEEYAEKIKYDLNGVKVWFHFFWDADGTVKHVGYLLQPDSKNVVKAEFRAFLSSFMSRYQIDVKSDRPFAHYSIASFPVMKQEYSKE